MRSLRNWLLYVAVWLPFAAAWFALVVLGRGSASFGLLAAVGMMGLAALMALGVWARSGRPSWLDARPALLLRRHLLGALGFALVLIGMDAVLGAGFEGLQPLEFIRREPRWLLWQVLVYCWLYGLVAGVSATLRAHQRLRERELAAARAEALAARAALQALRVQLNPHFLFNSLHSLAALLRHDPALAQEALERLGELLRYALDDGAGESVALHDEWHFVRNYLALEALRFGERLQVEIDLDPEALECTVPSFVLQPLVENAVRHGVAPRPEGGRVEISARVFGDLLRISVRDDGPGASREAALCAPGLGLRSLRQRLAARYDGASHIDIVTSLGDGFEATVTLPAGAEVAR